MGQNLIDHDDEVTAFNLNPDATDEMRKYGADPFSSLQELVAFLPQPRILWLMVPHAAVDFVLAELTSLLGKGDIVIETGNSHYKESIRRYNQLKNEGIHLMGVGTSGGTEG